MSIRMESLKGLSNILCQVWHYQADESPVTGIYCQEGLGIMEKQILVSTDLSSAQTLGKHEMDILVINITWYISENNNEYILLKNNQATAVLVSIKNI